MPLVCLLQETSKHWSKTSQLIQTTRWLPATFISDYYIIVDVQALCLSSFRFDTVLGVLCLCLQVAAQNGVSVTLVDVNQDLLAKGKERIETSLKRVIKKQFAEDQKV